MCRPARDRPSASLTFWIGGIPHLTDWMRLGHQPLQVVHEPLARVLGVLVVPAHVNRFFGADLLAVAAENTAELVDLEHERIAISLLVLARNQLDTVGRTHRGTQSARDALRFPVFRGEHAVRAAPPR